MAVINHAIKQITAKLVYFGPGLCGKTTNLQWIHEHVTFRLKGQLVSLATETDRTLFFDFLPVELAPIRGMKTRVQIYTVPGQVFYESTRRMVLKGADAVVFVADSQEAVLEGNVESLESLRRNLAANELAADLPMVFQYNKRDLKTAVAVPVMNARLNPRNLPFHEAVAIKGTGVEETLRSALAVLFKSLSRYYETDTAPTPQAPTPSAPTPNTSSPRAPISATAPRQAGPAAAATPPMPAARSAPPAPTPPVPPAAAPAPPPVPSAATPAPPPAPRAVAPAAPKTPPVPAPPAARPPAAAPAPPPVPPAAASAPPPAPRVVTPAAPKTSPPAAPVVPAGAAVAAPRKESRESLVRPAPPRRTEPVPVRATAVMASEEPPPLPPRVTLEPDQWLYHFGGVQRGPLAFDDLVDLVLTSVPEDTLVWGASNARWTPANLVHEISEQIPPPLPTVGVVREEDFPDFNTVPEMLRTALIADEDPAFRRSLALPLAAQGFRIFEARDGAEAWALATAHRPWVMLADLGMPEVDGFEFCRRVRANSLLSRRPLVFISGSDRYKERYRAMQLGADEFLSKQTPIRELLIRIQLLLTRYSDLRNATGGPATVDNVAAGALQGQIEVFGAPAVLQICSQGALTGIFSAHAKEASGEDKMAVFGFREGRLVAATTQDLKGSEAVYAFLTWTRGHFKFVPGDPGAGEPFAQSVEHLLLEGCRRVDEARAAQEGRSDGSAARP